jgi:hypothetical protein
MKLGVIYRIAYNKNIKKLSIRAKKFNLLRTINKIDEGIE